MQSSQSTSVISHEKLEIMLRAANLIVSPMILFFDETKQSGKIVVRTETYPLTLAQLNTDQWHFYLKKIQSKIGILHENGIYHGNLQPENILINPVTIEVRITNYDHAQWIQNFKLSELSNPFLKTLGMDNILRIEKNQIEYLYNKKSSEKSVKPFFSLSDYHQIIVEESDEKSVKPFFSLSDYHQIAVEESDEKYNDISNGKYVYFSGTNKK
jgi:serine/threonine protein kinase